MKPFLSALCASVSLWFDRLLGFFRRRHLDADMAAEMRAHLDAQTQRNLDDGMPPNDARAAAHRQFGGVAQIQERARDGRSGRWLEDFARDVRYGARALRKHPGFTVAAMLTLALGIGANASVFSVMQRLLFARLLVPAPEELVVVERHNVAPNGITTFPYLFFQKLETEKDVFAALLCRASGVERVTVGTESGGEPARGELVSGTYFDVLGVKPFVGRLLSATDDVTPGAHAVVVLSHRFWQRHFGGDPAIVGTTIRLTGHPMTVIGVSPPGFNGLDPSQEIDLRVPLAMQTELRGGRSNPNQRNVQNLQLVGRLRPGVNLTQARVVASARLRQWLDDEAPATDQNRQIRESEHVELISAATGYGQTRRQFQPTLRVLIAITAAVLLVACLNLASLLLARSATRQHEFALRLALGAGVGRLVQQLLAEGLLLALGGATLGAFLAVPGSTVLLHIMATNSPALDLPAGLNATVLLGLIATATVCGVLFGLAPAWQVRRQTLAPGLKGDSRGGATTRGRKLLVCAQVAASVVVLAGAGLFLRTVHALRTTHPGFNPDHLMLAALSPKNAGRNDAEAQAFFREVRDRVSSLPGVTGATYAMVRALTGNVWPAAIVAEGASPPENVPPPSRNVVGPDYFGTFGIPVIAGRDFTTGDNATAPKVAIVNERFAELYFPGQNPLGRKIGGALPEYSIIGVAHDIRHTHIREPAGPQWYIPYEQFPAAKYLDLCVRTTRDPEAMRSTIQAAIAGVDRSVAMFDVRTQAAQLEQLLVTERTLATLASFFGAITAALAAVGLYGLLAFLVAQQRREIGIRMALGADSNTVRRTVLQRGLQLTVGGIVLGLAVAFAATRLIAHLLFGVQAADPLVYALVAILLTVVSLLACWLPARKAARVNPIEALRTE